MKHLKSLRVDVKDMVHVKMEVKKDICLTGAAGLSVGEWVEVEHDFSPGNNSGGGVGIIYGIDETFSHVCYIIDGRKEKHVSFKRITSIQMPFRRETPQLRTRSIVNKETPGG
jgi:hypothetical protein